MSRPSLKAGVCDFGALWDELKADILLILRDAETTDVNKRPKLKWVQLYNVVYKLCTSQCKNVPVFEGSQGLTTSTDTQVHPHVLWYCLKTLLETFIREEVLPEVDGFDSALLHAYHDRWRKYALALLVVNGIFKYMNSNWIRQTNGKLAAERHAIREVRDMGLMAWRDHLYQKRKKKMSEAILTQIQLDRDGHGIERDVLRGILQSLVDLGGLDQRETLYYEENFEQEFLQQTEQYYSNEVAEWLSQRTIPQYMARMEARLDEEAKRVQAYLNKSTEEPLNKTLVKVMVEGRRETLLSECQAWFDNDQVEEQRRLYRLLGRSSESGLDPLQKIVEDRIDTDGKREIEKIKMEAQRDPSIFVETLLAVYHKYDDMVTNIFQKDEQFQKALEKGCTRFVNRNVLSPNFGGRSAELLAKHCHLILKPTTKAARALSEVELDQKISKVLVIFRLLDDRDVFQKFYSQMLSRRLILQCYTPDVEANMIAKLNDVCGYEYTYRLQRMFTDMDLSSDLNQRFSTYLEENKKDVGPDFSSLVLTSGSWPLQAPKSPLTLPAEVVPGQAAFEDFYREKHNGRKLTWLHQYSSAILKTCYLTRRTYELQVTAYQMSVLLLFNDNPDQDTLLGRLIQETTQVTERELLFALQILSRNKILIPSKEVGNILEPDQEFALNYEFKTNHRKVPLHTYTQKDAQDEQSMKLVSTDRKYAIQAAIVRIMKARKQITHQNLIMEVLQKLKSTFKPSVPDIKKNIDNLIEKEYMERDESVPGAYNYVA